MVVCWIALPRALRPMRYVFTFVVAAQMNHTLPSTPRMKEAPRNPASVATSLA